MLPNKVRDTVIIGVTILLVFAFILWFVSPAQAQMCSNFKEGAAKLKKDYGESPLFRGVSANGYMIVILTQRVEHGLLVGSCRKTVQSCVLWMQEEMGL